MSQMPTKYRVTHNGEPLAFGRVFFTISSGNTPAVTYKNAGLTSANTNPVILDENGEANVYLDSFTYRETVYDQHGALIRTRDGIQGDILTSVLADSRYVVKGNASSIGVTTREVISHVRTYVGALTGFSAYTAGAMIGIIPDAVAGADTTYYININGLGDRRIYSSIGGKPSLTAGVAATLVFDGTNFVVTSSVVLLSNQSNLDVVKIGTTEITKVTASVTPGTGKLEATYSSGDATLLLKGHTVSVETESDEYFTVNGETVATQDYVQSELTGNTALWGAIDEKIPLSQKGSVFGVASLDENQKVFPYQLPAIGGSGDVGAFNTIAEFTAGNGVTIDSMLVKDGIAYSNKPLAIAAASAGFVPLTISGQQVALGIEIADTHSAFDPTNSRFTAPIAGWYRVTAYFRLFTIGTDPAGVSCRAALELQKNGGSEKVRGDEIYVETGSSTKSVSQGGLVCTIFLSASDYVQLNAIFSGTNGYLENFGDRNAGCWAEFIFERP